MTLDTLLIYVVASLALALSPGPTMLLALSNGIEGGMRRASWGIAGASLGSITLIAVVALGLGSLLAASEWLFNAIWRSEATDLGAALAKSPLEVRPHGRIALLRSLAVALSNPKTVLFFAAFLPQFVDIAKPQGPQYLLLGSVFVALDTCVMLAYAGAGTQAVRFLSQRGVKAMNRGCAAGMWLLAATLAIWRRPGA